jgi:hypothetical protein
MESNKRLKLGNLYHSGILLEVFELLFKKKIVFDFLYNLSRGSRNFL